LELIILVGIPGSGKSTLTEELKGKTVSSDSLRKYLFGQEEIVQHDILVFQLCKFIIEYYLKKKWSVTFDATNTKKARRREYIEIAKELGAKVRIIWVDCPLKVALERNSNRYRKVPIEVIYSLYKGFEPPSLDEGVDVIEKRDKDMRVTETIIKDV